MTNDETPQTPPPAQPNNQAPRQYQNPQMNRFQSPPKVKKPVTAGKHFLLSLLAVLIGTPIAAFFIISFVLVFTIALFSIGASDESANRYVNTKTIEGKTSAEDKIVVLPINGIILSGIANDPLFSFLGTQATDGDLVKRQLRELADDDDVDAVVLAIDSPGGLITASNSISDGVEYFREETGKPIVAHVNGLGASGGYWSAVATDEIIAQQGSEVGSIGVIAGPLARYRGVIEIDGLKTTGGIEINYITAGRSKDLGNPFRDLTNEEFTYLNDQINQEYVKFVDFVSERRGIESSTIVNQLGALTYGTDSAKQNKLIDREGNIESVFEEIADDLGLDDYKVEQVTNETSFFGGIFGSTNKNKSPKVSESASKTAMKRYCDTNILKRPVVYAGDLTAICN